MSRLTQGLYCFLPVRGYHPFSLAFPDISGSYIITTGLFRFRSPLLAESRLISFPPATEMFQFAGFALHAYVFSMQYLLRGGFPHSEISGSKLICQLPEAYRRLSRPSSPIIAKASTTCSYSLDPITLTLLPRSTQLSRNVSGLSPDALCRTSSSLEVLNFKQSLIFVLTQSNMSLAARYARNLYECALSASNADSNSMNFLKNSRSIRRS